MYKLLDLVNFYSFYEKELKNLSLSLMLSYKLAMIAKEAKENLDFYRVSFSKIMSACGKYDDSGNLITYPEGAIAIREDKIEEFNQKKYELDNLEIECNNIKKVKIEELGNDKFTPSWIENLLPFIEN